MRVGPNQKRPDRVVLRHAPGEAFAGQRWRVPQLQAFGQRWPDRNTSMKRILLAAVLVIAGCGGASEPSIELTGPTPSKPSVSISPPPVHRSSTPAPVDAPAATTTTSRPRTPETTQTVLPANLQNYMLRLEAVQADLSSNERLAIARGNAVCDDVRTDASYDDLLAYTRRQFSTDPDHPISQETARAVYEVVRDEICPA